MGLDINFYKDAKLMTPPKGSDVKEWAEEQDFVYISAGIVEYSSLHFAHLPRLIEGAYQCEYVSDMPSRAYSTYNRWRDNLAKFAGYGSAENVWNNYKKGPFYELIHFSDCEGFITGDAVSKLHKDFSENKERIFSLVLDNFGGEEFKSYYEKFAEGLEAIHGKSPIIWFL